jgi:hypothetical protein
MHIKAIFTLRNADGSYGEIRTAIYGSIRTIRRQARKLAQGAAYRLQFYDKTGVVRAEDYLSHAEALHELEKDGYHW